ncbi:MAG: hypothetical protein LBC74_02325, partial [Planctomycetaceae bacterium]|nr:hypothetical protein [Planctomycetaceae bacterium]
MKNKQFFSNKSRKESIMNLGELNNPPMLLNVNFIEALTFWVRGYGVTPPRNEHYGVNDPKIKITIGTDNAVECYASDIFSTWWFVNSPLLSYSDAVKAIVDLKEKGLDCTIQRQGWVDIPD